MSSLVNRFACLLVGACVAACGGTLQEVEVEKILADDVQPARDGMALIDAGAFAMGCNEELDASCDPDELPPRTVELQAFYIDLLEVTERDFAACIAAGGCTTPATTPTECGWDPATRADYPVVCVSHSQARLYCAWAGKRLPTEAEWERAARGVDGRVYPWGNEPADCGRANSSECGAVLKPVGSLPSGAAPGGPLDMAGNAGEWTADWYNEGYYTVGASVDPRGPNAGSYRVIRGGTMFMAAQYARASNRSADEPTAARFSVGFRCAADAAP